MLKNKGNHRQDNIDNSYYLSFVANQSAKCPVSGCNGVWSLTHSSLDEEFKKKVDRYLRRKETAQALGLTEDSSIPLL